MVRDLFQSKDPEVMQLAEDVFQNCIVSKVLPPEPPFEHNWLIPGGIFRAQWIYDTPFVVDLLSMLPNKEEVIRGIFQNFWDFQTRWNKSAPAYAHDMIQNNMWPGHHIPGSRKFPLMSQIPILAWGLERVFRRNGDKELLKQALKPLERFHEWYWRERDVTNIGLVSVGTYSGRSRMAHFEGYDHECSLDGLEMTAHPTRKDYSEHTWYGSICVVSNTAHLVLAEQSLMRLAALMGDNAMVARRKARVERAVNAARTHMWDEKAGTFLSVHRDTLEKIPVATCGSWMSLWAQIPTDTMAERMVEVLKTPSWQTPLPLPTVDRKDKRFRSDHYFRGGSWPAINYSIASGLAAYGYRDLAADITDKMVANVIRNGISEYYDSISGKPLGVRNLGMVCVVLTMMLDGLCRKHSLEVRKT
jgi:neutral trehalase